VAAAAPAPTAPAGGASVSETSTITFTWTGSLQGDADAIDRSYFRVELKTKSDPDWSDLVNSSITSPGANTHTLQMGAPSAGTYSWRICAIGVVDDDVSAALETIGCSSARNITTTASASTTHDTGVIHQQGETTYVKGAPTVIHKTRPGHTTTPPNKIVTLPRSGRAHAALSPVAAGGSSDAKSATNLGDGSDLATNSGGSKAFSTVSNALGQSLPFVPIPFWALALLVLAVPLSLLWRRNALSMFRWTDGDDWLPEDSSKIDVLKSAPVDADAPTDLAEDRLVS
jgi:hypothetical protein